MLTINYAALSDRTARPVGSKPKARSKADWAWKPYRHSGSLNGRITLLKADRRFKTGLRAIGTMAAGRAKREPRG